MISSAKIAKLANLPLDNPSDFDKKLEETIKYVDVLKELNTEGVIPTFHVGSSVNRLREDVVEKERIIPAKKYQSKVSWN